MNSSCVVASTLGGSSGRDEAGPCLSCSSSLGVFLLRPPTMKNNAPNSAIPPRMEPTAIPAFAPVLSPELWEMVGAGVAEAVAGVPSKIEVDDTVC